MSHYVFTDAEDAASLPVEGTTNFYWSFSFLPKEERQAISTVYAFCRRIDDIVDENPDVAPSTIEHKQQRLNWWRQEVERAYTKEPPHVVIAPLAAVVRRFGIAKQHLLTVIDGCERDLRQRRYQTWNDLKDYCYAVASTVGLISIEIFGYRHEETRQYAIHLGYALQLTNILRDVKADKDRGYVYLPLEDLERFKYTVEDLQNEVYDDRFRALMAFEVQRAREEYHKARGMLRPDERMTMVAAEIMDAIYYRLLEKIELVDYDVFSRRVRVNGLHKLVTAARIWLGSKLFVRRLRPKP